MKYEIQSTEYIADGLSTILESDLLSKENYNKLTVAKETIVEGWKQDKVWRSGIEMRASVLNDVRFPTAGMKYYQARHEQASQFSNLMYLITDYEEQKGKLLILEGKLEKLELDKELNAKEKAGSLLQLKAKIKRAEWSLKDMEKQGHHRVREVAEWDTIMKEVDNGSFPKDDYDTMQKEGLPERWRREFQACQLASETSGNRVGILKGSLDAAKSYGNQIR